MKRFLLIVLIVINIVLFAVIARSGEVTLSWDANGQAPDGYRLFSRTVGQPYDYAVPVWHGIETIKTVNDLAPGKTYFFVVRAFVGDTESSDSNEVSYTVKGAVPGKSIIQTRKEDGKMFLISDQQSANDVDYFEVDVDGAVTRSDAQSDGDRARLHYDLAGIAMGTHTVRVRGVNGWGEGEWSDPLEFGAALPSKPSGIGLSAE